MANPFQKDEKMFSIGIPAYGNGVQYLPNAIDGLDKQDYKNFHVVVIFDGKNKKGEKIMDKLIKKYPHIEMEYHTVEHGGAPHARNAAVEYFKGDYYLFNDSDVVFYPETLRLYANIFDEHPEVWRIFGRYDIHNSNGEQMFSMGHPPMDAAGNVWYKALKYTNYIDTNTPIRAEKYIPWDESVKSLQDWDWAIRQLKPDGFSGKGFHYTGQSMFTALSDQPGGISEDSHNNWIARKKYVQEKNGIKGSDICVTSLGAMNHAIPVAEMLDCELLTMPSFKEHEYKLVYLLGFYTREDPEHPGMVTKTHMQVFERNKGKNVIHWIGTDIWDLRRHNSFDKLKELRAWFKANKIIHLCEAEFTQKELKELGIDAKIVPIPPKNLYKPMRLPKDFTVGVYLPGRDVYNENIVMEIVRSMPDVRFCFFGDASNTGDEGDNWFNLGYINFDKWMPNFSCNLRITSHDGLPLTPIQFMTAGRNVVTNVSMKGAIELKWEKDAHGINNLREKAVEAIRYAQKHPLDPKISEYWTKQMNVKKYVKSIRGLR
jgi:glycosyltransferase involved in cell wall biosynthesis